MSKNPPAPGKLLTILRTCCDELAQHISRATKQKHLMIHLDRAVVQATRGLLSLDGLKAFPGPEMWAQASHAPKSNANALGFFFKILAPEVRKQYPDRMSAYAGVYDHPDPERLKQYDDVDALEHQRALAEDALDVLRVLAEIADDAKATAKPKRPRGRPPGSGTGIDRRRVQTIAKHWADNRHELRTYREAARALSGRNGFETITEREYALAVDSQRPRRT